MESLGAFNVGSIYWKYAKAEQSVLGEAASSSVARLKMTVPLHHGFWHWDEKPWQESGVYPIIQEERLWPGTWKPSRRSFRMRFKEDKLRACKWNSKTIAHPGQQVWARNKKHGRGSAKQFTQGNDRVERGDLQLRWVCELPVMGVSRRSPCRTSTLPWNSAT